MKIKLFPEFKNPEMKYSDLDAPYRRNFTKKIALAILAFAVSCAIFICINCPIYILLSFSVCVCYLGTVIFTIYKSLTNQIQVIDTVCIKVDKKEFALFGSKDFSVLACRLSLKTENDFNILVEVPYSSSFKVNDIVRIYLDSKSLDRVNENTYNVVNYIFIHTLMSE